jgi:hypothetical protein
MSTIESAKRVKSGTLPILREYRLPSGRTIQHVRVPGGWRELWPTTGILSLTESEQHEWYAMFSSDPS